MNSYLVPGPRIYPKTHENLRVFSCISDSIFLESPNHDSSDESSPWEDCITDGVDSSELDATLDDANLQ